MTIWVNEQIDPCGIIYSCIACYKQKHEGWTARLRIVKSWDEVPVNALKLSF